MRKFLLTALSALIALVASRTFGQSMTIYCEEDPPRQIVGKDGKLSGISIEIVQEIQKRVGNNDPIQVVPWSRGYEAAQQQPNVVLFSMARTDEREALFHWIGLIMETTYGLYGKANSPIVITSLDDAKKLRLIGVYTSDVGDLYLTKAGFTNLNRAYNNTINAKNVMIGRIDAYATSSNAYDSDAVSAGFSPSELKLLFVLQKNRLHLVMSKKTPEAVVQAWSDAFSAMRRDGTYERIFRRYFPKDPIPK